ncbi:redoxin domain-containing protein [Sphingobacterium olei]|uniref:Redoxin domain-containing protein n=1 Tax=Sphingobacterium olei TaxID=2571155 RepID=A0A4V5MKX3_9SPHI|nr:redoxin domain-containing protein [Sphingobacterium olei]TJZ54948.1 redoxin domain-containing protein [Sphingobacterium olei]
MKNVKIITYLALGSALAFGACTNNANPKEPTTVNGHDGHDHSHEGHEHSHADHNHAVEPAIDSQKEVSTAAVKTADPIPNIPPFTFYKVKSGVSFTNADLPKGKKTIFVLFDPGCHHCRDEAAALAKNYNKLKDINLYFVSMNDPALMATFLESFAKELVDKPNVQVLYDRNQDFIQKFHVPSQFPANYVYDVNGKLQSYWEGDKNINEIITLYTK